MNDLLGRPIKGDIEHYATGPGEQDDPQRFLDALDEVLDTPGVEAVRWEQYTPYFNDGEACVFSVHEASVKLSFATKEEDEEEYDDDEDLDFFQIYDLYDYDWSTSNAKRIPKTINGQSTEQIMNAMEKFDKALNRQHYVVLSEKFGDPAQVTATKAGFEVEYYEHE